MPLETICPSQLRPCLRETLVLHDCMDIVLTFANIRRPPHLLRYIGYASAVPFLFVKLFRERFSTFSTSFWSLPPSTSMQSQESTATQCTSRCAFRDRREKWIKFYQAGHGTRAFELCSSIFLRVCTNVVRAMLCAMSRT